jgi:ERCC4-related helicase
VAEWRKKFSRLQGGKEVVSLTGETSADLRLLEKGDVIVCTPSQVRNLLPLVDDDSSSLIAVGCHLEKVAAAEECTEYRSSYC